MENLRVRPEAGAAPPRYDDGRRNAVVDYSGFRQLGKRVSVCLKVSATYR